MITNWYKWFLNFHELVKNTFPLRNTCSRDHCCKISANLFTGPFSVTKYSSDVNYALNKLPEGTDTGIFMFQTCLSISIKTVQWRISQPLKTWNEQKCYNIQPLFQSAVFKNERNCLVGLSPYSLKHHYNHPYDEPYLIIITAKLLASQGQTSSQGGLYLYLK